MKFAIPEISWHNRDPVLSVDFQPKAAANEPLRLATGGTDSHVLIWYISTTDSGSVNLEVAADLTRHQKAVNVVRWSPNGQYLASGDDESIIFVWKLKTEKEPPLIGEQLEEQYKETWVVHKTLRGHMEDVLDISWSPDSLHLASGSVDNKLLLWDVPRGKYSSILTDHKGFVQGVSWDPKGQLIATASTDRVFRTFDVNTKKVISRSSKAILPFPASHPLHNLKVRLYHDDTLQTYYRRLEFSPDGMLVAVPAGRVEPEQGRPEIKAMNTVYIYTRHYLKAPVCVVPCGEAALVCRWAPRRYSARAGGPPTAFPVPRMLLAIGTKRSVLIYDTQQKAPIALISNIHYTRLTDLTWSADERALVASSTDGYCSVITFADGELGEPLPDRVGTELDKSEPMEVEEQQVQTKDKPESPKDTKPIGVMDSFINFKAPTEKSPKEQKHEPKHKTPIKIDVLEEEAMPSWSDNSSNDIVKLKKTELEDEVIIEDSEDIKLVYDESLVAKQSVDSWRNTHNNKNTPTEDSSRTEIEKITLNPNISPKSSSNSKTEYNFFRQAKVTDIGEPVAVKCTAPSPKTPRRVNLITLSSPKNYKKKC